MSTQVCKHLVNDVQNCVDDSLDGIVAVNPGVEILEGHRVLIRTDIDDVKKAGKVTVVCGGGSGHEPAHGGYVGPGMLSAAVCGSVFASPPPNSILATLRAVGEGNLAGTLLVVKNYTGDRLNFGLAAERARMEGLKVEVVVVGEDCALTSTDKTAGRRGLTGAVLINKMAGALAEDGKSLDEIVNICQAAIKEMGTIGLSLSPCSIPGVGPSFQLQPDEMELGLGIHGEAGVKRTKVMAAKLCVDSMFSHMTNTNSSTHLEIKKGCPVALVINNLGGTSVLELNIVAKEAIEWLENHGLVVEQAYCGSFMTSLEMAGILLTVLYLNDSRRQALAAPTSVPAWVKPLLHHGTSVRVTPPFRPCSSGVAQQAHDTAPAKQVDKATSQILYKAVAYACEALGNCEKQLNIMDKQSGDGDCGATLKKGTDDILKALGTVDNPGLPITCPHHLLMSLSRIVESSMGGSSGALYSLFLTAAAGPLSTDTSPHAWCKGLGAGIHAVMKYGGAEPGDRTMLDSLHAACETLNQSLAMQSPLDAFGAAAQAAEQTAIKTSGMSAKAGRASYVSPDRLTMPDPGAHAVGIWLRAAYEACKLVHG